MPATALVTALPACPHCGAPLPATLCNTPRTVACAACRGWLNAAVFPAFFRPVATGVAGERIEVEGDASCYYHAGRQAVLACEGCGRFLCALCDVPLGGQHLCPACIEAGKKKGRLPNLHKHRVLYDDVALALAVYPIVIPLFGWAASILAAPASLVVAFRHWNTPSSVVPRVRWRFVVAILFALLEIAAWIALIVGVVVSRGSRA
jgi:hypothetical protein